LLLEWDHPSNKGTMTGKLFEYLGARRPILATIVEGGVVDNLLRESRTGVVANKAESMKGVLSIWLDQWRQTGEIGTYWKPRAEVVQRYTRKEQTRKLAELFDELLCSQAEL